MRFKEYLEKRQEKLLIPVLVSLMVILINPILGFVMLFAIGVLMVLAYFIVGRNLEYKKPEKKGIEDEIYVYKWYYNRAFTFRVIQVSLLVVITALSFTSEDFISTLFLYVLIALFGAILIYLSPRTITIERLQETRVNDVFWWNRHDKEVSRSTVHNKVLFLSYIVGTGFFFSLLRLTLIIVEPYRLVAVCSGIILCFSILIEIFFQITYGFEDVPKEALEYYKEEMPDVKDVIDTKNLLELEIM